MKGYPNFLDFGVLRACFIGYNAGMKQRREQTDTRIYLKKVNAFHTVSYRILLLANQGLLRTDFQREISKKLHRIFRL